MKKEGESASAGHSNYCQVCESEDGTAIVHHPTGQRSWRATGQRVRADQWPLTTTRKHYVWGSSRPLYTGWQGRRDADANIDLRWHGCLWVLGAIKQEKPRYIYKYKKRIPSLTLAIMHHFVPMYCIYCIKELLWYCERTLMYGNLSKSLTLCLNKPNQIQWGFVRSVMLYNVSQC